MNFHIIFAAQKRKIFNLFSSYGQFFESNSFSNQFVTQFSVKYKYIEL